MENYLVVLFKNKKRKKIIKKFVTLSRAKTFYDNLIKKSNEVIFDISYENGLECSFELGMVELSSNQLVPIYMTDDMGRNIRVKLEDDNMTLFQIKQYKKEELIFDVSKNKKITANEFITQYLKSDGLKMISSLNNKIIVQKDEVINLFSLKNESSCKNLTLNLSFLSSDNLLNSPKLFTFPSTIESLFLIKDSSINFLSFLSLASVK